jgi:hypothetical protein
VAWELDAVALDLAEAAAKAWDSIRKKDGSSGTRRPASCAPG